MVPEPGIGIVRCVPKPKTESGRHKFKSMKSPRDGQGGFSQLEGCRRGGWTESVTPCNFLRAPSPLESKQAQRVGVPKSAPYAYPGARRQSRAHTRCCGGSRRSPGSSGSPGCRRSAVGPSGCPDPPPPGLCLQGQTGRQCREMDQETNLHNPEPSPY